LEQADSQQTHITWGANENFAQDFARQYELAQAYFRVCRHTRSAVIDLFDCIHQVYVMEEPYLDDVQLGELKKVDADLACAINNCKRSETFMRCNGPRLCSELDSFFRKLNRIAVEKKFFPMAAKARSLDEKLNALRQK
jgi:hypothetical protein